jgi:MtN3 and saliva related transmembrane protein
LQLLEGESHADGSLVDLGAIPFHPAGCGKAEFPLTVPHPPAVTLLGYLAATLTTLSFFPQAIKTLRSGDTTAISLTMYLLLSVGIACWGIYGFIIRDGPVMVANAITLVPALVVLQRKISHMLHNRHVRRIQQG